MNPAFTFLRISVVTRAAYANHPEVTTDSLVNLNDVIEVRPAGDGGGTMIDRRGGYSLLVRTSPDVVRKILVEQADVRVVTVPTDIAIAALDDEEG